MYRLYQMKDTPENHGFLYQPFEYVITHGGLIHESRYDKVYEGALLKEMTVTSVRNTVQQKPRKTFSQRAPGTGDVITMDHMGVTECYYLDPCGMVLVDGFFTAISSVNAPLTPHTTNYTPRGMTGLWQVADTAVVDDHMFFLLESMKYKKKADCLILDAEGNVVIEHQRKDFDKTTLARLRRIVHPETKPLNEAKQAHAKPQLEHHQKYFENGTYERSGSSEVTEEQNYNMIDGRKNNTKRPEDRVSVRQRLREKLALVHGEPLPSSERMRQA